MAGDRFEEAVSEAVAAVTAEQKLSALERLRASVLKERRLLRLLTILSIFGCAIAIALGIEARAALDEFKATRVEARLVACQQHNAQQQRSIAGEKAQIRVVITPRERTPEEQARLDLLLERHDAAMEKAYPERDCSPEGIAAYYKEGTGT